MDYIAQEAPATTLPPTSALTDPSSPEYLATKRNFAALLDTKEKEIHYSLEVSRLIESNKNRLIVKLADLRRFDAAIAQRLLDSPLSILPPFEDALNDAVRSQLDVNNPAAKISSKITYKIGIEGSFGALRVTPRQLNSEILSKMVCVEGIVTKCSLVRPKIVESVHYCPDTGKFTQQVYRDATSLIGSRTGSSFPTKDADGNPLETEFGLCTFKNHQTITIQEMPEKAPKGQLPCSIDVVLDDDLVDICKPGDRVHIVGIYRTLAPSNAQSSSGMYRTMVLANNVLQLGRSMKSSMEYSATMGAPLTRHDIEEIRRISKRDDHFDLLSRSLAPSIFGHEIIKKSLILQLFGGTEQNLENGTHIRGDINVLMVGDPSTAKSQLLRSILNVAPLAISTTGRGSSGVGLTAAVVQDKETGERRLEAGAMVLGDRGIVCIDEFDKMSDADRVAIHEVMEQQTVTIAKAGIHTSLNARCSVLAAANPVYGLYDDSKTPDRNIGLPDSLLSRFDLLFIVLDHLDPAKDSNIADHVLRLHRYQTKEQDIMDDADQEKSPQDVSDTVFQKYNKLLHGPRPIELLQPSFLRKYVQFVRQRKVIPTLSNEAVHRIAEEYTHLRMTEGSRTLPITARLLETMIRLATAHAKSRLSATVDLSDCEVALQLLRYALYNDVEVKKKSTGNDDPSDADNDSSDDNNDESSRHPTRRSRRRRSEDLALENDDVPSKRVKSDASSHSSVPQARPGTVEVTDPEQRLILFRKQLVAFKVVTRLSYFSIDQFAAYLNENSNVLPQFTAAEINRMLEICQDLEILMVSDGFVSLILD